MAGWVPEDARHQFQGKASAPFDALRTEGAKTEPIIAL
jgi:hypothetical protein